MFGHICAGNTHGDPHLIGEIWGPSNRCQGLPDNVFWHDKQYWEIPKRRSDILEYGQMLGGFPSGLWHIVGVNCKLPERISKEHKTTGRCTEEKRLKRENRLRLGTVMPKKKELEPQMRY